MTRRLLLIAFLTLAAPLAAQTGTAPACPGLPTGVPDTPRFTTPECTWIERQYDPGVWLDNLGQYWIRPEGVQIAVKVKLEDLRIGK